MLIELLFALLLDEPKKKTKPSVSLVTAVTETTGESPAPTTSTFKASCTTCEHGIAGTVSVDRETVRFCCTSWTKEGERVSAKCPYSFSVPLDRVSEHYLENGEKTIWHLFTAADVDYAFTADDPKAAERAFRLLETAAPKMKATVVEAMSETMQKKARRPMLAPVESDCD